MYSGVPEHGKSYHRKGVAIALSADADAAWKAAISDFDPISERLLWIRIKMHSRHDICDNFRGIAMLSVPGKILCRIIYNRLKVRAELMLRENQCGFREGRGCVDQYYTIRMLMEKARGFHCPLYLCFIDLKKTYDSCSQS